ncbi:PREDICTED: cytochrome P450 10-like [Priapulus caudatus]|uniref:Cytochrome P450 10-like n=1 Tax=Priapulus caudatus TaxID=37621 RepID=A0ABM1EFQ7_PRICU|nr:PREDICTED: cytochrome P450 10-like [Priapulus caudatus]
MRSEGKYPRRIQLEPMVHFRKSRGMSLGLVNSQGEEWHRFRSLLSKKMLRPKEIEQYNPQINTVSKDLVERLGVVKADNSHIQGVELEIFKWALESVGTILFEERIGCFDEVPSTEAREFIGHVLGYFRTMQSLLFGPPLYKIRPTKEWLTHCEHGDKVFELGKAFVQKRVDALSRSSEAQTTSKQSSLLTHMLAASELSRDEVVHTLVDLMQGAIETTSNTVLWTLYQLATHPTAQEKLYNEVMNVVGEHGDVTTDALAKNAVRQSLSEETFRKFPVTFATSRIIPRDIEMGGYTIPKGSHVQASLYSMGRDPKLFNDPETYNPDRWLGMHNDEVSKLPSLAFGHGARMCIGRRIAEQEIYTGISQIVRKYKLEYDGPEVKPTLQLVMTPDKPIVMKFVPRR